MAAGDTNVGFTPKRPAESALSTLPQPDPEKDLAALTAWSAMDQRGVLQEYTACRWGGVSIVLRASCARVVSRGADDDPRFIENCVEAGKKPATIRRYVATITRAHLAAALTSPWASEPVGLALKEMGQKTSDRQRHRTTASATMEWVTCSPKRSPTQAGRPIALGRGVAEG